MKRSIRNLSGLGLLTLSASAILVGCQPKSLNKPHLTKLGCDELEVTYDNLEFGKEAVFTIKPKKYQHLRKGEGIEFVGEPLKPYVGYGNPIYQAKAPLTEGLNYTYEPVSKTPGEEGYETFKLKVFADSFKAPLVLSYRSTERCFTPQGKAEGVAKDITDCAETATIYSTNYEISNKLSNHNIEIFPEDRTLKKGYQTFAVTISNSPALHINGGSVNVLNAKTGESIYSPGLISSYSKTAGYHYTIQIPNDYILDESTAKIKLDLKLNFDVSPISISRSDYVNYSTTDNEGESLHDKDLVDKSTSTKPTQFVNYDDSKVFLNESEETTLAALNKGLAYTNEYKYFSHYYWVDPINDEDTSTYGLFEQNKDGDGIDYYNFKIGIPFFDDESTTHSEISADFFTPIDSTVEETEKLADYFKGYRDVIYNNGFKFRAYLPNYSKNVNKKMLIIFDHNNQSQELAYALEYKDLKFKVVRDRNSNGLPNTVGIELQPYQDSTVTLESSNIIKAAQTETSIDGIEINNTAASPVNLAIKFNCSYKLISTGEEVKNAKATLNISTGTGGTAQSYLLRALFRKQVLENAQIDNFVLNSDVVIVKA